MFTLPAWAQTMTGPSIVGQLRAQGVGPHPALVVGVDPADALPFPTQTEHLERRVDRDVRPGVGHDGHRRRALQPVPLDVPAGLRQDRVPGGGEGREVGHRGAR